MLRCFLQRLLEVIDLKSMWLLNTPSQGEHGKEMNILTVQAIVNPFSRRVTNLRRSPGHERAQQGCHPGQVGKSFPVVLSVLVLEEGIPNANPGVPVEGVVKHGHA